MGFPLALLVLALLAAAQLGRSPERKLSLVMKLENVVPFGRSLDEYVHMFNLTERELTLATLGVADGPASFNAELSAKGGCVTSVDPIYVFQAKHIQDQFEAVLDTIIDQVRATPKDWVWSYHGSPDGLRANRIRVTELFVHDFEVRRQSGRYVAGELPMLPFENLGFELALCSHFLFLYSAHLSSEFHVASVREMLRVAREVRIFPLLTLMCETSPHIEPVRQALVADGYAVEICRVGYELQRGGNEMMVIKRSG